MMACEAAIYHWVDSNTETLDVFNAETKKMEPKEFIAAAKFERFLDFANQGKRMELVLVYWSFDKYWTNYLRTYLRDQRRGRRSARQTLEKLNGAVKSKATNLFGWVNGKVIQALADAPGEDPLWGYMDDEASHDGAVEI